MNAVSNEFPRRARVDQMVPAELAIREAMLKVEEIGADPRLTEAVTLLGKAKDAVADFVDSRPKRFQVHADIVRDAETGLEWTRKDLSEKRLDWNAANEACERLAIAGGGWRLPTIKELLSLVDYERHDPAIDQAFECKSDWYWTSTPWAPSPADYAWGVGFYGGSAYYVGRDSGGFVRAVRGGQF